MSIEIRSFNLACRIGLAAAILTCAQEKVLGQTGTLLPQTLTFSLPAEISITNSPLTLEATASSGLPVTFIVLAGPAILIGDQLLLTRPAPVTVRASQAGDYQYQPVSVEQTFVVTFDTDTNCPPVLPVQPDQDINELSPLTITNAAWFCGAPGPWVYYSLFEAPSGATIDEAGIIRWTPNESQGPSTNVFSTFVLQDGFPQLTATNTFTVVVREVNSPPVLPDQIDRTIRPGNELLVINTATDSDIPKNILSYQLLESPPGATIDSQGIIRWTPGVEQVPGTNTITTAVTDDGTPPLTATNTFSVVVVAKDTGSSPGVVAGPVVNPATGHQYFLLEPASWTNAELAAVAMGGHLVTINTPEENTWVYETFANSGGVPRELWLGLLLPDPATAPPQPPERPKQFVWISGQPMSAQLWAYTNLLRTGYARMLSPTNAAASDCGRWAEAGPSTLLNSVIELPAPLEIVAQPQTISVGIGAAAVFRVFADGTSPLYYQWRSSGKDLPGETRATLTLTNVQPADSGCFSVVVSNASGTLTSDSAFFSVAGLVAWGSYASFDTRTNIPPGLTNLMAIAAGDRYDLALKADGTVVGWGESDYNQLSIPPDLTNAVAIAGALYHSLALKADGTVVSWGYYPEFIGNWVPADLTNVIAIDADGYHNVALKSDGTVVAWGGGDVGRPTVSPTGLTNMVAISAGGHQNLALKSDGTVVAWDDLTAEILPVPDAATNAVAISAGMGANLALRADGTVIGWGENWYGQLDIPPDLTNVVAISIKRLHALALKADGSVVAWGDNWNGESTVPANLPNVVAIAGGSAHSVALLRDGAPSLTVQPWDRSVRAGANPSFAAKAVGLQSMHYQWQFNGNDLPGATQETLSISNAQPADSGSYTLAVSNEVGVTASRKAKLVVSAVLPPPNHPPVLPAQPKWSVYELTPLMVVNTATDPDHSTNALTYQLIDSPAGATIDSQGVIRWTPGEAQGPGTFLFTTVVTKSGESPLSATNSFTVVVNEANRPPVLPAQPDRIISALSQLLVVNTATDPDIPANSLTYQLLDPPAGATIDSNGVICWTPGRAQGPGTNIVVTVAADNGLPPLSATNRFTVIVGAPTLAPVLDVRVNPGQHLSLTNQATDNDLARRLTFILDAAPPGASIDPATGVFSWRPPTERAGSSNLVRFRVTDDSALPLSDSQAFNVLVNPLEPTWLELVSVTNASGKVRVNGTLGPDYILQSSADLINWLDLQTNSPAAMPFEFVETNLNARPSGFYRVRLAP